MVVGDPLTRQAALSRTRHLTFLSHFLARYSIPLSPEQIAPVEGIRAAFVTVGALLPALFLHQPVFAWTSFAAFWCCLIEPGGTPREQLRILGMFTLLGGIMAGLGALLACASFWGILPLLTLTGLGVGLARALAPSLALLVTLLGCVVAAATGFPANLRDTLVIGGCFMAGGLWTMLICLVIWPLHPYASARRAVAGIYRLIAVMAGELAAGQLREAVHRQTLRRAIEQARVVTLQIDAGHGSEILRARLAGGLAAAERVFTAMLAVEHHVETRGLDFEARGTLAAFSTLCQLAAHQVQAPQANLTELETQAKILADNIPIRAGSISELVALNARTLATLSGGLNRDSGEPSGIQPRHLARLTPSIWRHALRLSVGLITTYFASCALSLHYGFWALVAVLLVIQPSGSTTFVRGMERVLGSVGGGALVLLCTPFLEGMGELLAAVALFIIGAIAMRAVSYTLLVMFLSAQFIMVTQMTMPSAHLPGVRIMDNTLGSLIGLICAFAVCPERKREDQNGLLRAAVISNLRYLVAVLSGKDSNTTDPIQRQAGIDTTRAEFSRGTLPIFGGISAVGREAVQNNCLLRALRRLSGEVTLLRFDMEAGLCRGDEQTARHWSAQADRLEAGDALDGVASLLEQDVIVAQIALLERARG